MGVFVGVTDLEPYVLQLLIGRRVVYYLYTFNLTELFFKVLV